MNSPREWLRGILRRRRGDGQESLAAVRSVVDDGPGWRSLRGGAPHEYDPAQVSENYADALEAWRKNPIAWRIISITTDYVVGDRLRISSPRRELNKFIQGFWSHPKNRMELRLEAMCDELSRSGDLFVLLFRNPLDGMSYLRFVTKDRIARIETAENDWENELAYHERLEQGEQRLWLSPQNPASQEAEAVMLHYAVNRPVGALLGESDLQTMLPWLQRYSRMLEDRVRLHWALRTFLWVVTVPVNKVAAKTEEYRSAPESGTVMVTDESEKWQAVTPQVHGYDARPDLQAVRQMIDAGSGYPPHWRGESADANLATATAMQSPTERHLLRRQKYFTYVLQDILFHAYQRAALLGKASPVSTGDYAKLFTVVAPDISRSDNESLARAASGLAGALRSLSEDLAQTRSPALAKQLLRLVFKFAGEPLDEESIDLIIQEAKSG